MFSDAMNKGKTEYDIRMQDCAVPRVPGVYNEKTREKLPQVPMYILRSSPDVSPSRLDHRK